MPMPLALVVDDDDDLRGTVVEILSAEGFRVEAAIHGQAAWNRLQHSPRPDVIVLDLMMPVLDGYAFRELQLASPLRSIPVVIMSAAPNPSALAVVRACGFVPKPFEIEQLIEAVKRCAARPAPATQKRYLGR